MATVYVTVITLVRVTILVLSIPLFILVVLVALTEGWGGVIFGATVPAMSRALCTTTPSGW